MTATSSEPASIGVDDIRRRHRHPLGLSGTGSGGRAGHPSTMSGTPIDRQAGGFGQDVGPRAGLGHRPDAGLRSAGAGSATRNDSPSMLVAPAASVPSTTVAEPGQVADRHLDEFASS